MGAPRFPSSLLLVGAGKMGAAMLRGWLRAGLDPSSLSVIDPAPSAEIVALARDSGFRLDRPSAAPEVLVLAIKPQILDEVRALAPLAGPRTLVLSILAGKRIRDISERLPQAGAIARAMPNLPAAVGRGMTGLVAGAGVGDDQKRVVEALIAATGAYEWVAEDLIDAVTAISGSGPAYVFYLVECLAEAGAALGLEPDAAARLARATVEGAGELLFQNPNMSPRELRHSVTSPGGTTAAALEALTSADGLDPLIRRTALAARRRAEALSG